ncbi:MAG: hypothetical protein L3J74_13750 [Bacteroidales bacterium]|nr:hypothetical protein [Bacteroidales bacterium]
MTFIDFISSVKNDCHELSFSKELKALCLDKNNRWDEAHELIQWLSGSNFALIHAYLHRKEGDLWNANYWYARAGTKMPDVSLDEEWERLARMFCE